MLMTIYRTYRPKIFSEIETQEHVVRTLQGALASGRIGQAYLFSGPRGTGKTTMARLMAKAINCEVGNKSIEPCNKCGSCTAINLGNSLDLIEVDAASNRGIDDIRNIKETASVSTSLARKKIFIIDEVHMLTTPAFNALLKTLEEPPSHVVFLMATTEVHKIPETILSRVQHFDFHLIKQEQIIAKLQRIAKAEKISADDRSLELIATIARGSMRDAESIFGKVIAFSDNKITIEQTTKILGIASEETHHQLLQSILKKKSAEALAVMSSIYEGGTDLQEFIAQFIKFTRRELLKQVGQVAVSNIQVDPHRLVTIIESFMRARNELKNSPIPQLPLEIAIVELTHADKA